MKFLVEVDTWPQDAEKLLSEALTGFAHTIIQVDVIGEVDSASDGYPWKRLRYTNERTLAQLPEGSPVYGEYR
jgi:hypothetical protein